MDIPEFASQAEADAWLAEHEHYLQSAPANREYLLVEVTRPNGELLGSHRVPANGGGLVADDPQGRYSLNFTTPRRPYPATKSAQEALDAVLIARGAIPGRTLTADEVNKALGEELAKLAMPNPPLRGDQMQTPARPRPQSFPF